MARSSFRMTVKQEVQKKPSGIIEGGIKRQTRQHKLDNEMNEKISTGERILMENSQLQSWCEKGVS